MAILSLAIKDFGASQTAAIPGDQSSSTYSNGSGGSGSSSSTSMPIGVDAIGKKAGLESKEREVL